jgi:hypothetical protein
VKGAYSTENGIELGGSVPVWMDVWMTMALSSWARAETRGLNGALGAKTPWYR